MGAKPWLLIRFGYCRLQVATVRKMHKIILPSTTFIARRTARIRDREFKLRVMEFVFTIKRGVKNVKKIYFFYYNYFQSAIFLFFFIFFYFFLFFHGKEHVTPSLIAKGIKLITISYHKNLEFAF